MQTHRDRICRDHFGEPRLHLLVEGSFIGVPLIKVKATAEPHVGLVRIFRMAPLRTVKAIDVVIFEFL